MSMDPRAKLNEKTTYSLCRPQTLYASWSKYRLMDNLVPLCGMFACVNDSDVLSPISNG